MQAKVFVTRIIPDAGLEPVRAACAADVWDDRLPAPYDTLIERVRGVDGILCSITERIDANLIEAAGPQLKVISQMAVGYDNIDVAAAQARGIAVGHTPGVLTEATADLTLALLLAAARRIPESVEYIRKGEWRTWEPQTLLGHDLAGKTLGIVGLGRIGKAVAKRAAGFELRLIAHGPRLTDAEAAAVGAVRVDLPTLLREADFVSLHTPLTPETRHLINPTTLAQMKPTAILVNTTRGPVVDQTALYDALTNGVISGAALDVTDPEPLPADDPLLTLPNVVIVPHIGSATVGTRNQMARIAADNLIAGVNDQPLPHAVPAQI
ncbi:MAG: D-glycerate dehydrogenase [Chloroflexi bacterium]|nr:D-glycerate dehydrogenase [Chloroflexota bacterium]